MAPGSNISQLWQPIFPNSFFENYSSHLEHSNHDTFSNQKPAVREFPSKSLPQPPPRRSQYNTVGHSWIWKFVYILVGNWLLQKMWAGDGIGNSRKWLQLIQLKFMWCAYFQVTKAGWALAGSPGVSGPPNKLAKLGTVTSSWRHCHYTLTPQYFFAGAPLACTVCDNA